MRSDIQTVLDEHPLLNRNGYGMYFEKTLEDHEASRQAIRPEAVDAIRVVIEPLERTKRANFRSSSYGLKHMVEPRTGYIANGEFIVAAILAGYKIKTQRDSINVFLNISTEAIALLAA